MPSPRKRHGTIRPKVLQPITQLQNRSSEMHQRCRTCVYQPPESKPNPSQPPRRRPNRCDRSTNALMQALKSAIRSSCSSPPEDSPKIPMALSLLYYRVAGQIVPGYPSTVPFQMTCLCQKVMTTDTPWLLSYCNLSLIMVVLVKRRVVFSGALSGCYVADALVAFRSFQYTSLVSSVVLSRPRGYFSPTQKSCLRPPSQSNTTLITSSIFCWTMRTAPPLPSTPKTMCECTS